MVACERPRVDLASDALANKKTRTPRQTVGAATTNPTTSVLGLSTLGTDGYIPVLFPSGGCKIIKIYKIHSWGTRGLADSRTWATTHITHVTY